ncbi:MAG TPA: SUMF1/EgtB/PvdO family nonheme iron enzyme [Polyangiaceae bacterium]
MRPIVLAAIATAFAAGSVALVATAKAPGPQCGDGFFPLGQRCCAAVSGDGKTCGPARSCPKPLVLDGARGACIAPHVVVDVPETTLTVGPSDWEADGIVRSRTIHVFPFAIDAFEITEGDLHEDAPDPARAAGGLSRDEVVAYCTHRGGRLPTEDEWIAAASGARGTRYPWGDTGAVCRRAAWGLVDGPCAHGARGPDTVGAHLGGDSALGVHDLAGNVAEWVDGKGIVLGGAFDSQLASELRVWSRGYAAPNDHDPNVGGRCAYDRPRQ